MGNWTKTLSWAVIWACTPAWAQDGDMPEDPPEVRIDDAPPAAEVGCLIVSTIRNFDGLDDRHVYVQGRRDEHFLLTMSQRCPGLRNAENIAISNPSNRICSASLAELAYEGVGRRIETCWISQIEAVEDKAAAEQLVALRARARDEE